MFLVGHRKRVRLNHTAFRRLCFSTLQLVIDITLDSYLLVIAGGAGNCALLIGDYLFIIYCNCAKRSFTCSIIWVYFASLAFSSSILAAGALETNFSLESIPFTRASSP